MTNCSSFPKWRESGISIKFDEFRYSWCENNCYQRKYLLESDYCNDAIEIYVFENDTLYTSIEDFKEYLRNKKGEGVCPLCGKPLVIKKNRRGINEILFLGCSGWPKCKFTKKA